MRCTRIHSVVMTTTESQAAEFLRVLTELVVVVRKHLMFLVYSIAIICSIHNNKTNATSEKNEMKCSLSNAYTQRTVTSGVATWLNSTGFTQFYLPPARLSTNGMSYFEFIS